MKRKSNIWILRILFSTMFIVTLLLGIILKPVLSYANKTIYKNLAVFHSEPLDAKFLKVLDQALLDLKSSELYQPKLHLDVCLNDGSIYPKLIKAIREPAFAWGFYNKVVLQGTMNCEKNYVELNGYKWNLSQLLAHEMTHCLQFDRFGLFKSKPFANIPNWKWEGYAEYVSRRKSNQNDLVKNLDRLFQSNSHTWEIVMEDSTISSREYYNYWTLVQYSLDIKHWTYQQLLDAKTSEGIMREEMLAWYADQKSQKATLY